jgi:hypothetical protein
MHSRVKHFFDDHLLNKAGVPHLIDAQRLGGPDGRLISRSRRVESQSDALFGCIGTRRLELLTSTVSR